MKFGRWANFSDCRTWRYTLRRVWTETEYNGTVCFIGLNPSTADEKVDDPTIRRCTAFAKLWGYDALQMLNLFAYRATDPKNMKQADDPVGPRNDSWIKQIVSRSQLVVAAWGNHGSFLNRDSEVIKLVAETDQTLRCLGITKQCNPKHPLYLRHDTELGVY